MKKFIISEDEKSHIKNLYEQGNEMAPNGRTEDFDPRYPYLSKGIPNWEKDPYTDKQEGKIALAAAIKKQMDKDITDTSLDVEDLITSIDKVVDDYAYRRGDFSQYDE